MKNITNSITKSTNTSTTTATKTTILEKLQKLQKIKQIGGKGTMRRKFKKKSSIKKTTQITFHEKQYIKITNQINNYYSKLTENSAKVLMTNFVITKITQLFTEFKRKDYHKKKIIENHQEFINSYILNNTKDNKFLLRQEYKKISMYFSKQGIDHINDFLLNVWDLINKNVNF